MVKSKRVNPRSSQTFSPGARSKQDKHHDLTISDYFDLVLLSQTLGDIDFWFALIQEHSMLGTSWN